LQAQTLQNVCPVIEGEFSNPPAELVGAAPGTPPLELEGGVIPDGTGVDSKAGSPGDCPGGMNGDCGELVICARQALVAASRAAL
jgi:hypothetical protein